MNGPTFATTSTAAPAPAAGARPAPPRPPRPAQKPPEDNPAARVLTYLRLHWMVILFSGSLLGGGLAYAAWTLLPPKYESYALFRVFQNPNRVSGSNDPNQSGRTEFATYVKTSAGLIQTQFVYQAALRNEKYRLIDLPTLKQHKDPFKFFDEHLLVSSKEGSETIRLSLKGDYPDDLRKIVDAVSEAFFSEYVEKEIKAKAELRDKLAKEKLRLENLLNVKVGGGTDQQTVAAMPDAKKGVPDADVKPAGGVTTDLNKVVHAGGSRPAVGPDGKTERMEQASFTKLNDQRLNLEQKLAVLDEQIPIDKARLNGAKERYQKALDEPAPEEFEKAIRLNEPDYLKAKAKAERQWAGLADKRWQSTNPSAAALKDAQTRAEAAEMEAEQIVRAKVAEADKLRRKPRMDDLQAKIDQATEVLNLRVVEREFAAKQLTKLTTELAAIPNPATEVKQVSAFRGKTVNAAETDLQTIDEQFKLINRKYLDAEADVLNAQPRIFVQQPASTPMQKETQKQIMGTVAAGLMGFAIVGAVMVLLEMRARKVSSLGELAASSPAAVVGVVPHLPDAATARDPAKRAEVNESIDKLRAYVAQTWLARGATTVTVTSPIGDEGKAFTAFGLASSLAQAGYKTLLADFDLRNPSLHPFAGVANALGVCELLRGEADFRRTIQVLPNGLHLLTAGKWSDDARQAAVGGRLEALLNRLKEPFDCVVLHGHALLTVAESVEVARRSEVVLLCALYRDTRMPMLKKAVERVAAMEIPYSGVVYLGATKTEALC